MPQSNGRIWRTLFFAWTAAAVLLTAVCLIRPAAITIQWQTGTEIDTAGFRIHRRPQATADFTLLTPQLIASQGSTISGSRYTYTDTHVQPGQTYTYRLEEIELSGTAVSYPHAQQTHTVPWLPPGMALLIALCAVMALLFALLEVRSKRVKSDK